MYTWKIYNQFKWMQSRSLFKHIQTDISNISNIKHIQLERSNNHTTKHQLRNQCGTNECSVSMRHHTSMHETSCLSNSVRRSFTYNNRRTPACCISCFPGRALKTFKKAILTNLWPLPNFAFEWYSTSSEKVLMQSGTQRSLPANTERKK